MIVKIQGRILFEFMYDADSADYGTNDLEEMLKIDKENIENDGPYALCDDVKQTIELSIVENDENGN